MKVKELCCLKRRKEQKYHQNRSKKYQVHRYLLYFNYRRQLESFQAWYMLGIWTSYLRKCMHLREKTPSADNEIKKRQCSTLGILFPSCDVCWAAVEQSVPLPRASTGQPQVDAIECHSLESWRDILLLHRWAGIFPGKVKVTSSASIARIPPLRKCQSFILRKLPWDRS